MTWRLTVGDLAIFPVVCLVWSNFSPARQHSPIIFKICSVFFLTGNCLCWRNVCLQIKGYSIFLTGRPHGQGITYWVSVWFDADNHEIAIFKNKHLNGYSFFASHAWQISVALQLGYLVIYLVVLSPHKFSIVYSSPGGYISLQIADFCVCQMSLL